MSKTRRKQPMFTQKGVALIAVTVAAAIVGVLVADFSTSTNIDQRASRNAEADMKAHFLARSSMNLSQLVVGLQGRLDSMNAGFQITDYAPMVMGAFGGSPSEVAALGEMLGGFAGDLEGLGVPEGSFDVAITTEDGKLNLNCAHNDQNGDSLYQQLATLFYPESYNPIFENDDADGWRRDRDVQARAFIDFIDRDTARYEPGGRSSDAPEDYGYETLRDRYEAKNSHLDTVGEIKLIRGVDDRFWALFGDAFTVYGGCKINLMAVDSSLLIASIIDQAVSEADQNSPARNADNLFRLATVVLAMKKLAGVGAGAAIDDVDGLIAFAKAPKDELQNLLGGISLSGMDPSQLGLDSSILAIVDQIQPLELDKTKLDRIATVQSTRRTYRVEATAIIGHKTKRIVGVWDKDAHNDNPNTRTPGNQEWRQRGAWVYWRED